MNLLSLLRPALIPLTGALALALASLGGCAPPAQDASSTAPQLLAGFRPPPNSPWTSADVTLFQHLAGSDGASGDVQALTPAQLSHIAKVIHEIHSHATPDGKAERRVLLMWLTGTSQVNAQVCMSKDFMFAEQPGHSYVLELTLGLAAAAIEGGTPAAQYTSALGGLLTYYRAERAAGTAADPAVEKLLAEQAAGTLAAHAVTLSACVH